MDRYLADYQLLEPLPGGPATTWLAQPPARLGEIGPVAIHELPGVNASDWPAVARRVAGLAAVSSTHLTELLEAGTDGPRIWISRRQGALRPATPPGSSVVALRIVAGAARGAHDLHNAGWAHGEIRPGTILVGTQETRLAPPASNLAGGPAAVTQVHSSVELDGYDADVLWGPAPAPAGDLYALGATLHALLTGLPLRDLDGDRIVTAVQRVLGEPATPSADIPRETAEIIRWCTRADPADRPPSALDLAERLEQLAAA